MSKWPENPTWTDPTTLNKGNKYQATEGVTIADFNALVVDLLYLKEKREAVNKLSGEYTFVSSLWPPATQFEQTFTQYLGGGNTVPMTVMFDYTAYTWFIKIVVNSVEYVLLDGNYNVDLSCPYLYNEGFNFGEMPQEVSPEFAQWVNQYMIYQGGGALEGIIQAEKDIDITASGIYILTPNAGYDGVKTYYVNVALEGDSFKGEWSADATYAVGNIVTYEGSVYRLIRTLPSWEEKPNIVSNVYWERLNTYVYAENYSPIAVYKVGTIAKYEGSVYLCIQDEPNMGYYPDQNPEYWLKLNEGGVSEDLDAVLTEQANLIQTLKETIEGKAGISAGTSGDMVAEGVAEVNLPNATSIRKYTFYTNDVVANVNAPNVVTVGEYAFYRCTNLETVSLSNALKRIEHYTFYQCTKLALISLPSDLTYISYYAFDGCSNLALTEIPSGVTFIDEYAFRNCIGLKSMTFNGYVNLYGKSFQGCTGLTSLTFTAKPNKIAVNAFSGCSGITTINVPWAEGEVANAPWGATNATINYNYIGT